MEKIKWDWDTVEAAIKAILDQATFDEVDIVVGIDYGGVIPAMLIKKKLEYADFTTIHPADNHIEWLQKLGDYDHMLFVDDINDSGATCSGIITKMDRVFGDNAGPYPVYQIVTLVRRYNTKNKMGLYGIEINEDDWIQFPWESDFEKPERDRYVPLK